MSHGHACRACQHTSTLHSQGSQVYHTAQQQTGQDTVLDDKAEAGST